LRLTCDELLFLKNPRVQRDVPFAAAGEGAGGVIRRPRTAGSSSLPNLKRVERLRELLDGVGGSDWHSSFRACVTRSSRRVYAIARVFAKSSTGLLCNNVIFSENPPSSNCSR
jgi:hypothetical protein